MNLEVAPARLLVRVGRSTREGAQPQKDQSQKGTVDKAPQAGPTQKKECGKHVDLSNL